MKIRKGDNVIVTTGKDKGKKGKVARAIPRENKIVIEGINIKKIYKSGGRSEEKKGQIIEKSFPIHVSNIMFIDPKTEKPTRIGYELDKKTGKKVRIAKKSGVKI